MRDIPFRAALFDLDGTLLDSLGVWRRVDATFFEVRGIEYSPEEYSRAVQGMSFSEAAEYTVRRYGLAEDPAAVAAEWMRLSAEEYARRVPLKKGARAYLRMLKRAGVKLAVTTANRPEVFMPALEQGGVAELFDTFCTCGDIGDANKRGGELFLLAARKLGVDPADCAVFEDTAEGIEGAQAAGMRAYAVLDPLTHACHGELAAHVDGAVSDFDGMRRYHPFPENRRRCAIFTARCEGDPRAAWSPRPDDVILCADAGWQLARRLGAKRDWVIGDFDSSDAPEGENVVRVPVEKDDTDTMLCLKKGLAMGFDDFLVVGGFGGRADHTLANLQALHYAARRGAHIEMADGNTWAAAVSDGAIAVPARPGTLSVFALSDTCRGVTIRGAKYAVEDAELTNAFPLGVSNQFAAERAEISVREGTLLVMTCREGESGVRSEA